MIPHFTSNPAFWLYLMVLLPYGGFAVLYATVSKPRDALGRSLLLSKSVIALLSLHACLSLAFGDYPGKDIVRFLCVGGAIVAGWSQLYLLVKEQRAARRCPEPKERTP